MPTPYIKKLAKTHGKSIGFTESKWDKAKQIAETEGKEDNFAYVTSIFKNMMGETLENLTFLQYVVLKEMDDVSDMGYGTGEDEDELGDEYEFSGDEDDLNFDEYEFSGDENEFSGDEYDLNFDEFDELDGHQLADILGPDEVREGAGHTAKSKLMRDINKSTKKTAKVRKNSGLTDLPKGQAKEIKRVYKGLNNTGVKNMAPDKYPSSKKPSGFFN